MASRAYNQVYTNVTWETCTMRSWLNNDFYNTAFNSTEQARIKTSTVVNADNPWYGTDGGNNTSDKLFLPSYSEVMNPAYGFSSSYSTYDTARRAQGTDFSKSNGLWVSTNSSYLGNSGWWLRSPGGLPRTAGPVTSDGNVDYYYDFVSSATLGARPAFKINLTSDIFTSKSGTGCVVDYLNGFIYGLEPGTTSLAGYVDVAPGYELSYVPDTGIFGTGTIVNVTKDGVTVESYTIIIYGDVNGDSEVDNNDAGWIVDLSNYKYTALDAAADAAVIKACDLFRDGVIDENDACVITDVQDSSQAINQTTGVTEPVVIILDYPESDHPYSNSFDKTWQYTHPQTADYLEVTL